MTQLSFDVASRMVATALAEGRQRGFASLTAAVLDAGGHVVSLGRGDGASLLRPQIAMGKAWGVLGMGFGGRELARRAEKMPVFFNALIEMSAGKMVPLPGGVLIRDAEGRLLGAIGISGDTSENDEICAIAAVKQAGLTADTGASQ